MLEILVFIDDSCGEQERQVAAVLAKAKRHVSVDVSFGDIIRSIRVLPDGTVEVEDVPQATGMTSDECGFICPPGRSKVSLPPPVGDAKGHGFKTPAPIISNK